MKKINLDIVRFLASLLIIAIHISPFDQISSEFDFFFTRILCRIAVPLFLMITGYFLLDKGLKDINILKSYSKKILKIYILCIIIYLPINIYAHSYENMNVVTFLKDILINGTFYHLWYFPALILGLWITYFLIKKLGSKSIIIISLLYIIGLFGDSYYGLVEMNNFTNYLYNGLFKIFDYTRNGIFYVPIFIYLGYLIKIKKKEYKYTLIYIISLFIGMTLEGFLLHNLNFQRHDSMYIFLIPLMYFLFNYLINHCKGKNKRLRNIATEIYIFHPLIIVIVRFISDLINLENIIVNNHLLFYIIVSISSLIPAITIEKVRGIFIVNGRVPKQIK